MLGKRKLPEFKTREEMLEIMQKEVYGYLPKAPESISFEVKKDFVYRFCADKATLDKVDITVKVSGGKEFTFPIYVAIPKKEGKHPFFIHINFRDAVPDRYMPTEEIIDAGCAVISFCYKDVTDDDEDFTNGLAGVLYENGERPEDGAGKIAMWAWAAHRAMDYAETLDSLDMTKATVCGHSRLGKTALFTAATDERFKFVYSNDSGCTGAAISRDKEGETVEKICTRFPYWFCKNYQKYREKEHEMPFDQHYLTACIAPRFLCVGSAIEDVWADPISEQLNCVATSKYYENMGLKGFICDKAATPGDKFIEGNIGYHLRLGTHYFSRDDWHVLIEFVKSK